MAVKERDVPVREKVIGEINAFPESKLYEIQEYIYFLKFKEQNLMNNAPLDDFDYELSNRHPEKEYSEYKDLTAFDDVVKMFGKTKNGIRN